MINTDILYSGELTYKSIDFNFIYHKQFLKLFIPSEKKEEINFWFKKKISENVYANGDPVQVGVSYIEGVTNDKHRKIVFKTSPFSIVELENSLLCIGVEAMMIFKSNDTLVKQIDFTGPEINGIYQYSISESKTRTDIESFNFEGNKVDIYFNIINEHCFSINEIIDRFISIMCFEFEATNNYDFVFSLCQIGKKFIQYLCYRKNIVIDHITLKTTNGDKALLYYFDDLEKLKENNEIRKRNIKVNYIIGSIGRILEDIALDQIYTKHLPYSFEFGNNVTPGSYITLTAGFEYEFGRLFDEIPLKDKRKKAEENVRKSLENLIENSPKTERNIYKRLIKNIKFTSMSEKIVYVLKKYDTIIKKVAMKLYEHNNIDFDYQKIANRFSKQRNDYAHGNLKEMFSEESILDYFLMEMVIYIMQLSYYNISESNIDEVIKNLFNI